MHSLFTIRELRKVRFSPDGGYTLRIPHMEVHAGDKIVLIGPSGAGKSTLLEMMGMILAPHSADRFIFAPNAGAWHDLMSLWQRERQEDMTALRRHIGYISQTGALLEFLTVRDNITLPRHISALPEDETVDELAGMLRIEKLLRKYPAQLSVGERQRVAIARALAALPSIILADEPTAALDLANSKIVLELLILLAEKYGIGLLLVTHMPKLTQGRGFRLFEIAQRITQDGTTEALLRERPSAW